MAVMSSADRAECWAEFMHTQDAGEVFACLKGEGRALIDALDQYLSDNAAAINTAIPQPARGAFTAPMKARAMILVVRYRYLKGV